MKEKCLSRIKTDAAYFFTDFIEWNDIPTRWNYTIINWIPGISNDGFTKADENIFLKKLSKEVSNYLDGAEYSPERKKQFIATLSDLFLKAYTKKNVSTVFAEKTKDYLHQTLNNHLSPSEEEAPQKTTSANNFFNNNLVSTVSNYSSKVIAGVNQFLTKNSFTGKAWQVFTKITKPVANFTYNVTSKTFKAIINNPKKAYLIFSLTQVAAVQAFTALKVNQGTGPFANPSIKNNGVAYSGDGVVCFRPLSGGTPAGSEACFSTGSPGISPTTIDFNTNKGNYFISSGKSSDRIWEVNNIGQLQNTINTTITNPSCTDLVVANNFNIGVASTTSRLYSQVFSDAGTDLSSGTKDLAPASTGSYGCSLGRRGGGGFHYLQYNGGNVDYHQIANPSGSRLFTLSTINTSPVPFVTSLPKVMIRELANGRSLAIFPGTSGQIYLQTLDSNGNVLDASGNNNHNEKTLNLYHTFKPNSISIAPIPGTNPNDRAVIFGISNSDNKVYGIMIKAVDGFGDDYVLYSGNSSEVEFTINPLIANSTTNAFCDSTNCDVVYASNGDIRITRIAINGPFPYVTQTAPTGSPTTTAPVQQPTSAPVTPTNSPTTTPPQPSSPTSQPTTSPTNQPSIPPNAPTLFAPTKSSPTQANNKNEFPTGAVVGGGIAGLLVIGGIIAGVAYSRRNKGKNSNTFELEEEGSNDNLKFDKKPTIFADSNGLFDKTLRWLGSPGSKHMTSIESGDGKEVQRLLQKLKDKLVEKSVNFEDPKMLEKKVAKAFAYGIANTSGVVHLDSHKKLNFTVLKNNISEIVNTIHVKLSNDGLLTWGNEREQSLSASLY